MAYRSEPAAFYEGQSLEEIQRSYVIPYGFHGAAFITERFEVRLVIGQQWVCRNDYDKPPLREVTRIGAIVWAQGLNCHTMPILHIRRMKRQYAGKFPAPRQRSEEHTSE